MMNYSYLKDLAGETRNDLVLRSDGVLVLTDGDSTETATYREWLDAGNTPGSAVPLPGVGITYKADIWRRATDEEAETIVAVLAQQPTRKQRLFNDATVLSHADPEFAELTAGFVVAFGQDRADELLAPSE